MTIQEQFGCRICKGTGIFDEHEEIGFRSCASCSGSGLSDAKILAYVKEKGLENVVAGVRIVEELIGESDVYISNVNGSNNSLYGFGDGYRYDRNGTSKDFSDLNTALDHLLLPEPDLSRKEQP